jgi:hypothetical protein
VIKEPPSQQELEDHFKRVGIELSTSELEEIAEASVGLFRLFSLLRRDDRNPDSEILPRYIPDGRAVQ